ncbi:MAG: hypothetical protein SGJ27_23230 [Candidatus Melainabacteria bacterium]|nr:hypothetical protein [Candidatus Melainabacteria bacterium]
MDNVELSEKKTKNNDASAVLIDFNAEQDSSKRDASKNGMLDTTKSLIRSAPMLDHSLSAISARVAYFGVTDQLHVDQYTMRKSLERMKSPVAKQLVDVMDDLVAKDWQILKEPLLSSSGGSYNEFSRRLWYSERFALPGYLLGQSPVKRALSYPFSHELGHHKPSLCYSVDSPAADAETMAKRHLLGEAKAMLTEIHITEELKVPPHSNTLARKTALSNGSLGAQILIDHAQVTSALRNPLAPKAVQDSNVNRMVNSYLEETFGRNLIDPETGKVRPFDLKAGINGPVIAELAEDPSFRYLTSKYKELRNEPDVEHRSRLGRFFKAGETKTGSIMMRGLKGAGAVGGMLMVTDVYGAFQDSSAAGFGRIGKLATEVAGFEAGTASGTAASLKLLSKHPKTRIITSLGAGLSGAYGAGEYIGKHVETMIKGNTPITSTADRPMTPTAQKILNANLPIR